MKKEEMEKRMVEDLSYRKEWMIKSAESELKCVQKYFEELKEAKDDYEIINKSRAFSQMVQNLAAQVNGGYEEIEKIRLGLYYLENLD